MTSIARLLSYLQAHEREYLLQGSAALKQELFYSKNSSEITDTDISSYTKEQMIAVQKSMMSSKLEDRVKQKGNDFVVDQVRTIKVSDVGRKKLALEAWTPLQNFFWKATVISGSVTAALMIIAFQHIPAFFIIAATASAVAVCIFTGLVGERYHVAQKQVNNWENPGNHLALARTAAFEKNFVEILEIKTYPLGGLLPKEIQPHYGAYLSSFAQNMLKYECPTPEKQYEWLENFFKITPHPLDAENLRDLFGKGFDIYGQAFIQLEVLALTVTNSRITPVIKALGKLKEEKYRRFEEFTPAFFEMVKTHYQQEAARLKATVLQNPPFLLKAYNAAVTLLKQAHEAIVEAKQVAVVDATTLGPRPATFHTISDDFDPAAPPADADYAAFLAEVKKRTIQK